MAIKYSIVVAAYNVENYIDDCLDSLIHLDYEEEYYEVIVVDDGSQDNTYIRACKWKDKFKNLTVVTQQNNCQGAARNKGISMAKGDFLMFADADDWYSGRNILKILDICITKDIDFIKSVSCNPTTIRDKLSFEINTKVDPKMRTGSDLLLDNTFRSHIWMGCYRKSYIESLHYPFREGVKYEDTDWSLYVHIYAKKVFLVDVPFYSYFYNPQGTTSILTIKTFEELILSLRQILNISKQNDIPIEITNNLLFRILNNLKEIIKLSRNQKSK